MSFRIGKYFIQPWAYSKYSWYWEFKIFQYGIRIKNLNKAPKIMKCERYYIILGKYQIKLIIKINKKDNREILNSKVTI
jgi:hypothetical protein